MEAEPNPPSRESSTSEDPGSCEPEQPGLSPVPFFLLLVTVMVVVQLALHVGPRFYESSDKTGPV